jgi:hypothetical protein
MDNSAYMGLQFAIPGLAIALLVGVWYWAKKRNER